jgi:dTDP-4-amino-4,6-dideoxygalactose transaminase
MVRFQRPQFPHGEEIEEYLARSREIHWYSNNGPCCMLLRDRLQEATDRPCVPVASGTLGLMVGVAALRERARPAAHEVLVPSFAFAASAQAAAWNGLRPVFVDVAPGHWHLDPVALEAELAAREGRVALVLALSSFGTPPPPEVRWHWEAACHDAGVPLLVDSAAGYGAHAADGVPIGGQGDLEIVSFHATKPLAAGEGGAVFCRDERLAARIAQLGNFAFDAHRQVDSPTGLNAKLSEPAAAAALAALDHLPAVLEARSAAATQILDGLPTSMTRQDGHEHGTWQFVPVLAADGAQRRAALTEAEGAVEIRTYYEPLHEMPGFAGCETAGPLPVTRDLSRRTLSLPMANDLQPEEIDRICSVLREPTAARDAAPIGGDA